MKNIPPIHPQEMALRIELEDLIQILGVENPTELDKATFLLESSKVESLLKEGQYVSLSYRIC